jgi:GNAT superfamily N-acetyltransferase
LYLGYAEFYQVNQTKEMRDKVWSWIMNPEHEVSGLIASNEKGLALGIAHYRIFARPLSATLGGFLDDLFVTPSDRGNGIGKALISAVAEIGRKNNWSVVRWITAEDNHYARAVYDNLATETKWVTYDIKL